MIDSIATSLVNGFGYIRKHPELIMTMLLVVCIPVAFIITGEKFLSVSKEVGERLEKERIMLLHEHVWTLHASGKDSDALREILRTVQESHPDITRIGLVNESYGIFAEEVTTGESSEVLPEDEMILKLALIQEGETVIVPDTDADIRMWRTVSSREEGDTRYYVRIDVSFGEMDALFDARVREAYYWLLSMLVIVLLLVLRHVRLIDYAYLYRQSRKEHETKDTFMHMIAHELRAPLTGIKGYASIIRESSPPHDIYEKAGLISDSTDRLLSLIGELLDVARLQSGRIVVTPRRTNVAPLLEKVLGIVEPLAREKKIRLGIEGVIHDTYTQVDPARLEQVLINLVNNAIKYTKTGSIQLSLTEKSRTVELRVKDTGMGISAEDQKRLFAPFFRVQSDNVDHIIGTGLGMWITKELVELMHGSIGVESIKGVGTHIVLTLPKE